MIKIFEVEVEVTGEHKFFIAIDGSCLADTQEIIDDQCCVRDLDDIEISVVQSVEIKSINDLPYGLDKCVPDFYCDCIKKTPGTLGEILKTNEEIEKGEKDHPDQLYEKKSKKTLDFSRGSSHLDLGI